MTFFKRFTLVIGLSFFIFSSNAADFFWVGGTGNWSDTNSWSATSGVPVAIGTLPTATDNVIFDGASGLAGIGDIVTMDIAVVVNDFDFSAIGNSFTLASVLASIEIQGSLSSNGLANITWTGDINMNSGIIGNFILSNGTNWDNDFHIIGTEQITISDLFSNVADFYVDNGGLIAVSTSLTCADFYSNTTNIIAFPTRNLHFYPFPIIGLFIELHAAISSPRASKCLFVTSNHYIISVHLTHSLKLKDRLHIS